MRKQRVRHEKLPRIGDLFEIATACGLTVTVVAHRSGRRDLTVGKPDEHQPLATVALTRTEATALATLLSGAHIELTMTPLA